MKGAGTTQPLAVDRPPDTTQVCPQCGATIPVYEGYVSWCDRCGWNLQPVRPRPPRNVVESVYASMGRRLSDQLYAEIAAAPSLRPRATLALVLAYLIAALVHGLTLLLIVGGIILIAGSWGYWLIVAVGVIALGVAWLLRPRIPRLDDEERAGLIARSDFPALYALVDQVAAAVRRPPVDYLVVDGRYNAAFGAVGWRWRKLLILGLPLFTILEPQERVAVLGHELAHGANGDASRSFFVATAIRSLVVWYRLLRPAQLYRRRYRGLEAIAEVIANVAMLGLAQIVRGLASALVHLLWRNKQRAEYLADALGAQVSGTAAMLSQLDKLHLSGIYGLVVRRYALGGGNSAFFDMLQAEVAQVPERERERIRRVARLHGSRLDATHPPTPLRIDMLREHLVTTPLVVLSAEDNARIDAELAGLRARTQHEIADAQSARLYY